MKGKASLCILSIILAFVCIGGCRRAGNWLVRDDNPTHADAMLILMGTVPDRVLQIVDLYNDSVADIILIVQGADRAFVELEKRGVEIISGVEQIRRAFIDLGIPEESIMVLRGNVQSTQEEALITREYIESNPDIDTLLLVSSSNHMRRACMIFNNAFKASEKNISVLCSPSPYTEFNAQRWWKDKNDIELVLSEYAKMANFCLFERRGLKKADN